MGKILAPLIKKLIKKITSSKPDRIEYFSYYFSMMNSTNLPSTVYHTF